MLSKMRIWSPHLFCLWRLRFLTQCQKKSVSSTKGLGSESPLSCPRQLKDQPDQLFLKRNQRCTEANLSYSRHCPSPAAHQPQKTLWLLVIPCWCSPRHFGLRDSTIFAASLCWPSLFFHSNNLKSHSALCTAEPLKVLISGNFSRKAIQSCCFPASSHPFSLLRWPSR